MSFVRTLVAVLREIFDENAYARFLAAQGRSSSGAAYGEFLRERFGAGPRRCC